MENLKRSLFECFLRFRWEIKLQMPRDVELPGFPVSILKELLDGEISERLVENVCEGGGYEIVDQRFHERNCWLPGVVDEEISNRFHHNSSSQQVRYVQLHVADFINFHVDFKSTAGSTYSPHSCGLTVVIKHQAPVS